MTQTTRIELWQVLNYGASFQAIVEVTEDGKLLQAMTVNGPRDEVYYRTNRQFNEADTLSDINDAPRHTVVAVLESTAPGATTPVVVAATAPVADAWTRIVTVQRMTALNKLAVQPAYKNADGKFNLAKLEATLGFSLKELQAARKRHGL